MIFRYLLLSVIVIGLSLWITLKAIAYELEEHGIMPAEEGGFRKIGNEPDEEPELPSFSYCFKPAMCEAFQVGSGLYPTWIMEGNIELQVLPEPQIIIHREGQEDLVAESSDYVARNEAGMIWVLPEKDMDEGFRKVRVIGEDDT